MPLTTTKSAVALNAVTKHRFDWACYNIDNSMDTEPVAIGKYRLRLGPLGGTSVIKFLRTDLAKSLNTFLSLDWEEKGYLLLKSRCEA